MARPKLPPGQKRVCINGKVAPETKRYLESLGEPNVLRALDKLVAVARTQLPDRALLASARKTS